MLLTRPSVLRTQESHGLLTKIKPPYRNETNQRYSKQLFWEQWVTLPIDQRLIEPPFTLTYPKEGLVCLGREYIADGDPSGYTTATRIFKDFGYWAHLKKASWFREALKTWDEELEAKLYSEGLMKIRMTAASDDKNALVAARYLANKDFRMKDTGTKRGRPSNEEVEGKLNQIAEDERELEAAAERIQLKVVN